MTIENISFLPGYRAVDDRGSVSYVNDFSPSHFKRFYSITNHSPKFIRAWHGHMKESKAIHVVRGSALVAGVPLDSGVNPSTDAPISKMVLSEHNPGILHIPKGYANGIMTLTADAIIIVFSTSSLEESTDDDYRFPHNYWDIWQIEQR